jgi:hypothetical protein
MFCCKLSKQQAKVIDSQQLKVDVKCSQCKAARNVLILDCKHNCCIKCYNKGRFCCKECEKENNSMFRIYS